MLSRCTSGCSAAPPQHQWHAQAGHGPMPRLSSIKRSQSYSAFLPYGPRAAGMKRGASCHCLLLARQPTAPPSSPITATSPPSLIPSYRSLPPASRCAVTSLARQPLPSAHRLPLSPTQPHSHPSACPSASLQHLQPARCGGVCCGAGAGAGGDGARGCAQPAERAQLPGRLLRVGSQPALCAAATKTLSPASHASIPGTAPTAPTGNPPPSHSLQATLPELDPCLS